MFHQLEAGARRGRAEPFDEVGHAVSGAGYLGVRQSRPEVRHGRRAPPVSNCVGRRPSDTKCPLRAAVFDPALRPRHADRAGHEVSRAGGGRRPT